MGNPYAIKVTILNMKELYQRKSLLKVKENEQVRDRQGEYLYYNANLILLDKKKKKGGGERIVLEESQITVQF